MKYSLPSMNGAVYAQRHGHLAVEEMARSGIPASITLAQGMIESAYGGSLLSREGNNHFGIKCHGWSGGKMYLDDDGERECFRIYASVRQSYRDHTEFLKNNQRYRLLFHLRSTDYRSWAYGLRSAGYATDPKYPSLLISLIERDRLYTYDTLRIGQL